MTDEQGTSGAILVVGGGISGLTAALEAAEVGNDVFLVEKGPYFGGRVAQLNQYFPKLCPPSCGLEINFKRIKRQSQDPDLYHDDRQVCNRRHLATTRSLWRLRHGMSTAIVLPAVIVLRPVRMRWPMSSISV